MLATRSPQHFARAIEGARIEKMPLYVIEQQLIGISHGEVGAYLLALWGLPSPVVEAVAHHHLPGRIPNRTLDAVGTVHIANVLAHQHPVYPPAIELLPPQELDAEFLSALGLAGQTIEWDALAEEAANRLRRPANAAR